MKRPTSQGAIALNSIKAIAEAQQVRWSVIGEKRPPSFMAPWSIRFNVGSSGLNGVDWDCADCRHFVAIFPLFPRSGFAIHHFLSSPITYSLVALISKIA